jgi:hypothetical protein
MVTHLAWWQVVLNPAYLGSWKVALKQFEIKHSSIVFLTRSLSSLLATIVIDLKFLLNDELKWSSKEMSGGEY